uniref:Integrase catalytic domain-containing protein n=1 Tax=Meloidogyne enterolobii TaxID=390850 RepID=A0A6V7W9F6_MELEN|nr:unnamed protein product [Meloidogyne enterolobii]
MKLQEFVSNSIESISHLPENIKLKGNCQKFLGIDWQTENDSLSIKALSLPPKDAPISKRAILTFMASHFDPLGLISPVILPIKIFLQSLWNEKIDWDEKLSEQSIEEWNLITQSWDPNSIITIPRRISQLPTIGRTYQIHCFTDASNQAMCAAVYLRISHPSSPLSDNSLIFSKSKVKPINKPNNLTIPRLELIAALMGTRALKFIYSQLTSVIIEKPFYLWCDSTAVISWLNNKTPIKDIFVQNRINEMRKLQDLIATHLPGTINPADIGSRGTQSLNSLGNLPLWWSGPEFLKSSPENWPKQEKIKPYISKEYKQKSPLPVETPIFTFNINATEGLDLSYFSRLPKLLRVLSYMFRFIYRVKNGQPFTESESVSLKEMQQSLKRIIRSEQKMNPHTEQEKEYLGIYDDPEEILRCKGRLGKSKLSLETKEPILLPARSHLTCLIIYETHLLNNHSSPLLTLSIIRKQFWIPSGRRISEKSIHKCCLSCRRYTAKPFNLPPFPQFPIDRVEPSPPFTAVGLDFCGPLYIKTPFLVPKQKKTTQFDVKKYWITLWVCLATRAISLDLIPDLTLDSFSLAFRGQTAKHGLPKTIYCDNAPTFIATKSFLSNHAQISPPKWHFRTPGAAWKGGHYERLVALIKGHLKRTLAGGAIPRTFLFHEVSTILLEIELVINSRPITADSANPSDPRPLCPLDFLKPCGHNITLQILPSSEEKAEDPDYTPFPLSNQQSLSILWEKLSNRTKAFWSRWKSDYILSLRERHKKLNSINQRWPITNELVIVYNESTPRSNWSLAVIKKIFYTEDNFPNTAQIKFLNGNVSLRSVHHLSP